MTETLQERNEAAARALRNYADLYRSDKQERIAENLEIGASAIDQLASPDYIRVPRADAEKALEHAKQAGRLSVRGAALDFPPSLHEAEARRLLGLKP